MKNIITFVLCALCLCACSRNITLLVTTAKTLNTDAEQRSLPLELEIYQLKAKDFIKNNIVAYKKYIFYASGQQHIALKLNTKAQFILAKANYRVADDAIEVLLPLQQASGKQIENFSVYLDTHHLSMEPLS